MYTEWKRDPQAVHESWRKYFESGGAPSSTAASSSTAESPVLVPIGSARLPSLPDAVPLESSEDVMDHMKIQLLVRAYQARGHHIAKLDPLGILDPDLDPETPKELKLSYYGFKDNDLEKTFTLGSGSLPGIGQTKLTLQQIVDHLKHIYCEYPCISAKQYKMYSTIFTLFKVVPLALNTSIYPTKMNAIGLERD
jgi:2-oxoglutarate dehydrogenase E1 component